MRFLLIGTGFGERHLSWISQCPDATVEFIGYHHDEQRALRLAEKSGTARITSDPLAVIAGGQVDAVAVASPPATHEPFLRAAMAAGLLTVSDKPLAADAATARRLAETAQASERPAAVIFQWRVNPALRELRQQCRDGALGQIVHIDLEFHHDFLATEKTEWPWRHRRRTAGAGALGDQGVHLFDLLRWMMPGAWSVSAASCVVVWPQRSSPTGQVSCETDDVAEVLVALPGRPTRARVYVSRVSTGHRRLRIRVQGTTGTMVLSADPDDGSATLTRYSANATKRGVTAAFPASEMNPYIALLSASRSCPDAVADFSDGYAAQTLLEEAWACGSNDPSSGS